MISATDGDGVDDLKRNLAARVPPGPWHYPADDISDAPMRMLAAEITREKIYHRLHDELPYHSTVETTRGRSAATARCASSRRSSSPATARRRIMLGKGGQTIKQMSMDSRRELTQILERPVHLFLFVKVRPTGRTTPSATARWASSCRRSSFARRAIPDGTRPPPYSAL